MWPALSFRATGWRGSMRAQQLHVSDIRAIAASCVLTGDYGSVLQADLGLGTLVPTRRGRGGGTISNGTDRLHKEVGHLARRALGKRLSGVGQGDGLESSL